MLRDIYFIKLSIYALFFFGTNINQLSWAYTMGNTGSSKKSTESFPQRVKGVDYNEDGSVLRSIFQQIADGEVLPGCEQGDTQPGRFSARVLLHCDDRCACFVPIKSANDNHVLVVPRRPGSRL